MKQCSPQRRGVMLAALLAGIGGIACSRHLDTTPPPSSRERGTAPVVRLDLRPLTSRTATYVRLDSSGRAEAVEYEATRLVVTRHRRGSVPATDAQRLTRRTDAALAPTMPPSFSGGAPRAEAPVAPSARAAPPGAREGDTVRLWSGDPARTRNLYQGLREEAPAELREAIREMVALARELPIQPGSSAYLRADPIASARLRDLRADGQLRFHALRALSGDLRGVVAAAIAAPHDFHPISRTQYDRLLKLASSGHELFLVQSGAGHQLTLYRAR
jgi:hypothetical protein